VSAAATLATDEPCGVPQMIITIEGWRMRVVLGAMGVLTSLALIWLGVVLVYGLPAESGVLIDLNHPT
jgi:hypothetical protein